ncbi:MAG: hypothetical protein EAX87_04820, partial [Candidatus Thorarchaeota archaeon]|nr:hypothetical protein [Candidatus Thorarchaeota archaeon]
MKRKKVLVMFIGMCMIFTLGMPVFIPSADATPVTIYAPDPTGDPETDSTNIQNALDSMNPGDTLYLAEGRYKICRPLMTYGFHGTITGAGMDKTFIEAVPGPLGYFETAHMSVYDGWWGDGSEDHYTAFFHFGSPETSIAVSDFT